MFTGFASENTPAIQVWDFFSSFASTTAIRSVSLADDCAPIQYFRTGSSTTAINVYLPTAPIEGKTIRVINTGYASSRQAIRLLSSENSGDGANSLTPVYEIGSGQVLDLTYSKNAISYGPLNGIRRSGWVSTNMAPASSGNFYSIVASGRNNHASSSLCGVFSGLNNVASGQYSFVSSGSNNTASNSYAVIVGGDGHSASGSYSATVGGLSNIASGTNAAVVGGTSNTASGQNSFVGGGSSNLANQSFSAVVGGGSNTATGTYSFIGSGFSGTASGSHSTVLGGTNGTASNNYASVLGGITNSSSGSSSAVIGGTTNNANASNSVVVGGANGTARSIIGNCVTSASNNPITASSGRTQAAALLLGRQTTDATATVLTSNISAAGTSNQVILPNNSAYMFQGTVIANVTAGGTTAGWTFEGVIKRGATAASTVLVAAVTPTVIAQDAGAAAWVVAVTADTTNGGIAVTVTGAEATTIRWVCKIETTEVTF